MKSPIIQDENVVVEAMMAKDCAASQLFNTFYKNERPEVANAKLSEWAATRSIEKDFAIFCEKIVIEQATRGLR